MADHLIRFLVIDKRDGETMQVHAANWRDALEVAFENGFRPRDDLRWLGTFRLDE
jgi:hypothetical protein